MALSDQVFSLLLLDRFPSFFLSSAPTGPWRFLFLDCVSGPLSRVLPPCLHSPLLFILSSTSLTSGFSLASSTHSLLPAIWHLLEFSVTSHITGKCSPFLAEQGRDKFQGSVTLQVELGTLKRWRPLSGSADVNSTSSGEHFPTTGDHV